MKKLILATLFIVTVALTATGWAFPPMMGSTGGGVELAADCNTAAYYAIGTLCQQTGDGKLFKGTGAAVVEITAGTGIAADGSVAWTGAPVPNAANTIALGSNAAEWADLFLGDGAIIYGQNDISNTITSSAAGWIFALPINLVSTGVKLTGANGVLTILGQGDGADENMTLDFNTTSNLVTIASGTSATFAFTPNVAFTGDITVAGADITLISATAGAGITGGDGTISLKGLGSGTDEIMTIDLNTSNLITIDSSTSATFAFTPAVAFTASVSVGTSLNPDTDGGATIGTKNTAEWQNLYLNTGGTIEWENGDVTLTHSANTLTLGGGDLALGANNLTLTGSVGATGAGKATKLWAVDAELTNLPTINGGTLAASLSVDDLITLSGVAGGAVNLGTFTGTTITDNQTIKAAFQLLETAFEGLPGGHTQNTDTGTDSTTFTFGSGGVKLKTNSGVLEVRNNADSAYDDLKALTIEGTVITATTNFAGALTGNVTGNVSGTAATVTGAAQTAITSVGTLTGLTVSGAIVPNAVGTIDLGSTSAELRNIFLGNGGILYGQIDHSATLTSSLNTWTASNFATTGIMTIGTQLLPDANDGATIGISGTAWSDLFLASGAVIDFSASDVTLTHSSNTLTLGGGDLALGTNNITGVGYISFGADPADAGAIRLSNNTFVFSEKASTGTDISVIGVDASDVVQIAASGSSGVTITPAATFTGEATFNGNITAGNADTDTLTIRSMIIGGNSRAVQIAASVASPTYATATNELYVAGDIETAGTVYAAAFNGGLGTDGQRGITLTSNTNLNPTANQIYFISDVLYFSQAGTQKTPMRLEDAQEVAGLKTFKGGLEVGNATTTTVLRLYDGSSNYWSIAVPAMAANYTLTLPADDGTANQALITDGSGTLSWGTVTATAHGSDTYVQFNDGGSALGSDAGFTWNKTTDRLTLGSSGGATTGTLDLYYTGTTYAATITPNASMSGDVTITLPSNTSTLIGSGSNTFTGAQILSGVNPADGSLDSLTLGGSAVTLGAFNGSDTFRGIYLNYTNANHTGTGNTVALIDIPAITGDTNSNFYGIRAGNFTGTPGAAGEVERFISVGTGFDHGLYSGSPVYVGDGTNGTTIGATGNTSFAGTATLTLPNNTTTANNTAEASVYWESDTDILTIGDGATGISLDFTANTAIVFPATSGTLGLVTAPIALASQASGDTFYATSGTAIARLAKGTAYQILQMNSGATAPEWTSTLSLSALNLTSATSAIPWPVGAAALPTAEGSAYWTSATDKLTIGDGATSISLDFTANTTITFPAATGTLALTDQTMYIGTTQVAINRASAALTLAGITLTTPDIGAATGTSLMVTGRVDGTVGITESSAALAVVVATHGHSAYFINSGADEANSTFTLPAVEAGLQYCFKNATGIDHVLKILAVSDDVIDLDGADTGAAGYIHSGGALGDAACVVGVDATHWYSYVQKGTFTAHAP
jgi:hypothetical protein